MWNKLYGVICKRGTWIGNPEELSKVVVGGLSVRMLYKIQNRYVQGSSF